MLYFKAKMHRIRFRTWLRPRLYWGSSQHSPDLLAEFKGSYFSGNEERNRKKVKGKEGTKGRGREKKGG